MALMLFSATTWAKASAEPVQAEQIFTRWLAAYNDGNGEALQAVLSTYGIDHTAQRYLDIRETFGPLEMPTRTLGTPDAIAAIGRGTSSERGLLITVAIDPVNRPPLNILQLKGVEVPDAFKPARAAPGHPASLDLDVSGHCALLVEAGWAEREEIRLGCDRATVLDRM